MELPFLPSDRMQKEEMRTGSALIPQVRLLRLRKIDNSIDLLHLPRIPLLMAQHWYNSLYLVLAGRRAEDGIHLIVSEPWLRLIVSASGTSILIRRGRWRWARKKRNMGPGLYWFTCSHCLPYRFLALGWASMTWLGSSSLGAWASLAIRGTRFRWIASTKEAFWIL